MSEHLVISLSPSEAEFLSELEERRTREPTGWFYRPDLCLACGQYRTPEGHDPCIANLPGVDSACCGHGLAGDAYVVRGAELLHLHGPAAARKMSELGGHPPPAAYRLDPIYGAKLLPEEVGSCEFVTRGSRDAEPQGA